ncbi:MAG TPA: glycoside hydrolase family 38 C-terminal domain-containing protein [Acidimicrobiales bacterium]|nr:glycoside hydrolase family 38 C-terminal domain-containing protein [Acidimicrobiales bacterium]
MAGRRVAIVPHTHWDREWYSPFQTFRLRLADLLDEFLPRLDADLSYARFLLDGQMAVVDDYLEIRPDAEPVLRRLAASGRLAMGPWYTLPDEFLVSGETHVRNLQLGLARAAAFGGAMDVGYLPDMFGHIAQMPQILSQFGFGHAVVWRGVPAAVDRSAFWWAAPDGTTVRAEYLVRGYGSGAAIPDDAKTLVERVRSYDRGLGEMLAGPILFMNGTDHQVPQPWLGRVVAEANELQDDYHFVVTSLAEHLTSPDVALEGLPVWHGELRSGARANLLMGVGSNRVDVKQAAARAERELERLAEPLSALVLPAQRWPGALLDLAWREVIRNAAHDSVCACSSDEVVAAVLHRYAEARQIAEGLTERAVVEFGRSLAARGPAVLNPSARRRGGVVEVVLEDDAPVPGTQVLRSRAGGLDDARMLRPGEMASLLSSIHGRRLSDTYMLQAIELDDAGDAADDGVLDVVFRVGTTAGDDPGVEEARRTLYSHLTERRYRTYRVRLDRPPVQRLLARVAPVAAYGWHCWSPGQVDASSPVSVTGHTIANGHVTVEIDPTSGELTVDGVPGHNRLVHDGDAGDTYNYCPPSAGVVVDRPEDVSVEVLERGPVRAVVRVVRIYTFPTHVEAGARVGAVRTEVETLVTVHAGEPVVRLSTSWDNRSRDCRLRAVFPLAAPATTSTAECAFATVERGLTAEGGPSEAGLPTFPSRRFVRAGDVTLLHEGLLEYELLAGGSALALTLLRATGMLSQGPMPTRSEQAGPTLPVEGAQMLGRVEVHCALAVGAVAAADPYALVDDVFVPLLVAAGTGEGERGSTGTLLDVAPGGAQVSALRRVPGGALELRVFNPSPEATTVDLGPRRGWLVDLRGRPTAPVEGAVELAPWRIATLHLA